MIDSISWSELAELTHATQVERFGWCICEDPEQGQLADDCPRQETVTICGDCLYPMNECEHGREFKR